MSIETPEGPWGDAPDPRDVPDLQDAYDRDPWDEADAPEPGDYADLGPVSRQKRTLRRAWPIRPGSGWRP